MKYLEDKPVNYNKSLLSSILTCHFKKTAELFHCKLIERLVANNNVSQDCRYHRDCQEWDIMPTASRLSLVSQLVCQTPQSLSLRPQRPSRPHRKTIRRRKSLTAIVLVLQFLTLPSSAQVDLFPTEVVAGLGGGVAITCVSFSSQIESVEWLINGTSLNDGHRSDGVTQERDIILLFSNVSVEYNNTRIQCRADSVTSSETAMLLVQGILSAVGSLVADDRDNFVFLHWTAPFTLDITRTSVDITYCVDVVSSTSSATLHSECGINVTEFAYPLPARSGCDEYNFTVMPVNVGGNGTKVSTPVFQLVLGPHLMEVKYVGNFDVSVIMSAPVCEAELIIDSLDTEGNLTLTETYVAIEGTRITFSLKLLEVNRQYSLTVLASNTGGQNVSVGKISTHDITNCTTYNNFSSIIISVGFKENCEATGALLNFIFINEDGVIDFSKFICLAVDKDDVSQDLMLTLDMWYPGQYVLYAYDIESDKMIMNGVQYQASSGNLAVMNGQARSTPPALSTSCSVDSYAGVITVACSFLFQVIAQLNALDRVNILHVNTSMDPQTPVTLQVTENGEYLVTILPVQDGRGIISTNMQTQIINVNDSVTTQNPVSSFSPTISPSSDMTGIVVGTVLGLLSVSLTVVLLVVIVFMLKTTHCHKALKKRENVYVEAQVSGRRDSITVRMSRSGPSTTTTAQDDEPAYAMVHDVTSDVRSYSPADVEESSVQQDSVQSETTQGHLEEANIPTYTAVKKPHKKTPPSARTEPSHPPPSYDSVILPSHSDQETSSPVAIPVNSNVEMPLKRLASAPKSQSDSTSQSEEEINSSPDSFTPLIDKSSLAASRPTPLSAEGQRERSTGANYVVLDHPKMATSPDVINVHLTPSEYAIPAGYKNEQNETYAFLKLKEGRDKQHELELANDVEKVEYAELAAQIQEPDNALLSAKEEASQEIED